MAKVNKDGLRRTRLLVLGQDDVFRKKWGRLSPDGTNISYPFLKPTRTYVRDRLARKWWPTMWSELGLSKGQVECYLVLEEWSQPVILNPHSQPIHNFVSNPNALSSDGKRMPNEYLALLKQAKANCVPCEQGELYSLVPAHKVHEFKHNKVEKGLVEESAREDGKANTMQMALLVLGGITVLFLALLLYNMGLFNLETWTQPHK